MPKTLKVLNGLPMGALTGKVGALEWEEVPPAKAVVLIARAKEAGTLAHWVRHPATAKTFGLGQPHDGLATLEPGDRLLVLVLAKPRRGQEAEDVKVTDFRCFLVQVRGL